MTGLINKNVEHFIKTAALFGDEMLIEDQMGTFKCPTMNELGSNKTVYVSLASKFMDMYEECSGMFEKILSDKEMTYQFGFLMTLFFCAEKVRWEGGSLCTEKGNKVNTTNVALFMEVLKILHHRNKSSDRYVFANSLAEEMMREAMRREREIENKVSNKDGIGFLEIASTLCARHPSINTANIGQLNYYQVLDQYRRLMLIDAYAPCLYGNATEEYVRKIQHYSTELVNK